MFKHLLVPLDGSSLAEAALPVVRTLGRSFHSEITLLRIVTPPFLAASPRGMDSNYVNHILALHGEGVTEATTYLEALAEELAAETDCIVNAEIFEGSLPAYVILDIAGDIGADTIVMNTHGRSGIGRWLMGSVAEKVVRHADIPILLTRGQPEIEVEVALSPIDSWEEMYG